MMVVLLALIISLRAIPSFADEGMWVVNDFPAKTVEAKYNVSISTDWLRHVQLSSALLNDGCSGGFVSQNGLLVTNHHCLLSCIGQLSSSDDIFTKGFYAKNLTDELRCPDFEVSKLIEIKDVTDAVREQTKKAKNFSQALKSAIKKIEKDCAPNAGLERCRVISLYGGSNYHLYRYNLYKDVRLVFAPEYSVAFYGGYLDNFEFPRYGFDVAFLRVYQNSEPLKTADFLKWSAAGAQENETIFVTGNPGHTLRHLTLAELEYERDSLLPAGLLDTAELRGYLSGYQSRDKRKRRTSTARLYAVENDFKSLQGRLTSLHESDIIKKKSIEEKALREKINANPKLKKQFGGVWDEIESSYKKFKDSSRTLKAVENIFVGSQLLRMARDLVDGAMQEKCSNIPIDDEYEITMITYYLNKMSEKLGADHPSVKRIIGTSHPKDIAAKLVRSTSLKSDEYCASLVSGGKVAVEKSQDPVISFAKAIKSEANLLWEPLKKTDGALKEASEKVQTAYSKVFGAKTDPGSNLTLRISYGTVSGIQRMTRGTQGMTIGSPSISPFTAIQGVFDRHTGSEPFSLPEKWLNAKSKLNLKMPFNFISDADVAGGSSGSPVINKNAEVIGVVFDGNIYSLSGIYGYDQKLGRTIALYSEAVIEVLKKVYGAERIVNELTNN